MIWPSFPKPVLQPATLTIKSVEAFPKIAQIRLLVKSFWKRAVSAGCRAKTAISDWGKITDLGGAKTA